MAYTAFDATGFSVLPEQDTLRAVFNAARDAQEAFVAAHADSSRQATMENLFNAWIASLRIIARLPDLEAEKITRTLIVAMIDGSYKMSMYDNHAPLHTLGEMRRATAQSPEAGLYDAAIQEIEDDHTGKVFPFPSVVDAEYAIVNTVDMMGRAGYLTRRAAMLKAAGIKTLHPKEYEHGGKLIESFRAMAPDAIPPSLHVLAGSAVTALESLRRHFTPAPTV